MILFKGRSSLKQYNTIKPMKRGYKLWEMADMDGYLYKFKVYQGKCENKSIQNSLKFIGLGDRIICQMTVSLHYKHYEVYADNFFTSVPLMEYLSSNKVLCCGTIRTNKKCVPKILAKDQDLERGAFDYRVSKNDIVIYKWKDNKLVHIISNFDGTEPSNVQRKNKDDSVQSIPYPEAVSDYDIYMGGVDKADMLCSLYGISRKSKKWWHRIFFDLVDRSICNAYVVYNKLEMEGCKLLSFRRSVAQSLITIGKPPQVGPPISTPCNQATAKKRRKSNFSVPASIPTENVGIHWVVYDKKRGRCEVCSRKKIEARPYFKCSACIGIYV